MTTVLGKEDARRRKAEKAYWTQFYQEWEREREQERTDARRFHAWLKSQRLTEAGRRSVREMAQALPWIEGRNPSGPS
jgi:hypothetical protein